MAIVAGVKITLKPKKETTRITSQSIRENAKRDRSPNWDNVDEWDSQTFHRNFRKAMDFYRMESSSKELKSKIIDWMGRNGYDKETIKSFKDTKDGRCVLTMGAVAACLLKGMPSCHVNFNNGRDSATWLGVEITKVIAQGKDDEVVEESTEQVRVQNAYEPTIQDRLREAAGSMSEELDAAIDSFIGDPDNFNPKDIKVINLLKGKGAKAAHARFIKLYFARGYGELLELAGGNADDQLREAYKHLPRKNIKKLIEFYEAIMGACEQIYAEQKVLKKPRAAKVKPAEQVVAKLKFQLSDTKLGITSSPPATIIGASGVVVYNTKTRKIGYYIASSSAGLSVKGTSLIDFTDKSTQKTLRKPLEQIKEFKEQNNTQKRFEAWFTKNVKTTETQLNGRFNEDTIILKVYK